MKLIEDDDLLRRGFAAYFRGGAMDQPARSSAVEEHGGRSYVVLRNVGGVLAVYRVRNDGMLKGLRRWPVSISAGSPPSVNPE
jgi:hypothetical protein